MRNEREAEHYLEAELNGIDFWLSFYRDCADLNELVSVLSPVLSPEFASFERLMNKRGGALAYTSEARFSITILTFSRQIDRCALYEGKTWYKGAFPL
jgi:hypothetical protein